MVDDKDVDNIQSNDKNKRKLTMADASKSAAVIKVKCEKCGQYYFRDEVHHCH